MSHYVVLSGATGVGKTTWSEALADSSEFEMAREPQVENIFLRRLHRTPEPGSEDALASQAEFLLAAAHAQLDAQERGIDLLHDNSIHEINAIYTQALLEAKILTAQHGETLRSLYWALRRSCPKPDIVILMTAKAEVVAQRRALRGRATETSSYQASIDSAESGREQLWQLMDVPVLRFETSELPPPRPRDRAVKELWRQIRAELSRGDRHQQP